ncbi:hypothetical protein NMY22_g10653 [Coprinellus aureogranulatus]|nr:hypothetical protein NMY22_g10653 [Coprinellus aureogranulatus]
MLFRQKSQQERPRRSNDVRKALVAAVPQLVSSVVGELGKYRRDRQVLSTPSAPRPPPQETQVTRAEIDVCVSPSSASQNAVDQDSARSSVPLNALAHTGTGVSIREATEGVVPVKRWKDLSRSIGRQAIPVADTFASIAEGVPLLGPMVKGPLDALVKILKGVEQHCQNREDIRQLSQKLIRLQARLEKYPACENTEWLISALNDKATELKERFATTGLDYQNVADEIARCEKDISHSLDEFMAVGSIQTRAKVEALELKVENLMMMIATLTSGVHSALGSISMRVWIVDPFGVKHQFTQLPGSYEVLAALLLDRYSYDKSRRAILQRYRDRPTCDKNVQAVQEHEVGVRPRPELANQNISEEDLNHLRQIIVRSMHHVHLGSLSKKATIEDITDTEITVLLSGSLGVNSRYLLEATDESEWLQLEGHPPHRPRTPPTEYPAPRPRTPPTVHPSTSSTTPPTDSPSVKSFVKSGLQNRRMHEVRSERQRRSAWKTIDRSRSAVSSTDPSDASPVDSKVPPNLGVGGLGDVGGPGRDGHSRKRRSAWKTVNKTGSWSPSTPKSDAFSQPAEAENVRMSATATLQQTAPGTPPTGQVQGQRVPVRRIRCKMCRQQLAGREQILQHGQETVIESASEGGEGGPTPAVDPVELANKPILTNAACSGYFVEALNWMDHFLQNGETSGKITCPNQRCKAKLGNYDWVGVECGCKEWVIPSHCGLRHSLPYSPGSWIVAVSVPRLHEASVYRRRGNQIVASLLGAYEARTYGILLAS